VAEVRVSGKPSRDKSIAGEYPADQKEPLRWTAGHKATRRKEQRVTEAKPADNRCVLVPLDGSPLAEQAIPYAQAVAGQDGKLVFVHVLPEPEPIYGLLGDTLVPADEVLRLEEESAKQMLRDTVERWRPVLTTDPEIELVPGDPAEAILAAAERHHCQIIAMASHGRGAVGRLAFGSVADRVARTATLPVLIIRPHDATPEIAPVTILRIVVPHDGSPLADEALPVAAELAKRLHVPILVIRAVNPAAALLPAPVAGGPYPAEIYQELEEEMVAEARASLGEVARRLEAMGVQATTAVVEGPPVVAIEGALADGDIIVMTSHGRSGIARWVLGSVAEKLIRSGPAPVVLVPASVRGTPRAAGASSEE
jgi:nucleotide-binding universal stress UspA family protein